MTTAVNNHDPYAADVIVIGCGAGGGFVTAALAEAGLSVLVIERGPWYPHEKFPMRHPDWEKRRGAFASPSSLFKDSTIARSSGTPIAEEDFDLCTRSRVDHIEKRTRRSMFHYLRVQGVGGCTLHYEGEAHRFPPHAFKPATLFGHGIDWPLDYAELEPWYEKAERWLGVAGEPGNPFKAPRGSFPTPGHHLSTRSQWVKRASDQLGWTLLSNTLAQPTRSYDGRTPCQHSGGCVRGCPFGAKSSVDLAVLPRALKTGRVRVLDGCQALELETGPDGAVNAVVFQQDGKHHKATAQRYVLAGGGIETPRLLLASQSGRWPNGVGNDHDLVGRHLMETIFVDIGMLADRPLYSWKGVPMDAKIWDFNHPGEAFRNGYSLAVSGSNSMYHGPLSYARRIGSFGLEHKRRMREEFGARFSLTGIADHAPHPDNRVLLADETDAAGMPKVTIQSDYYELDRATLRHMIGNMLDLAKACDPMETGMLYSTYSNPSATHLAGTCLMGDDPAASVTNRYGQVHGVPNLFITDASVLPGQGMGDSPSLTIQALALRTADHIIAE